MSEEKKAAEKGVIKIKSIYLVAGCLVAAIVLIAATAGYSAAPNHQTTTITSTVTKTIAAYTSISGNYTLIPQSQTQSGTFSLGDPNILLLGFAFAGIIIAGVFLGRGGRY